VIDAYGRPYPNVTSYPSAADGRGFRTLADKLNAMGLKLGVWTLRGIPRRAVTLNTPIFGSPFNASDAVGNASCNCEWSPHTVATNAPAAPAVAFYRSLATWYAEQGIAYVKLDCMWRTQLNLPEHTAEVLALTAAFRAVNITVSLSPGAYVSTQNASFIVANEAATAYRVTQDLWDLWEDPNGPNR
jgi:alpha-galactosidase